MKKLLLSIAAGAIALAMAATTASATVVNWNGTDYKITTKTGNFLDLNRSTITDGTRLQDQPWWGDIAAANQFAGLLGSVSLPYFATSLPVDEVLGCYLRPVTPASTSCTPFSTLIETEWAVARMISDTEIPVGVAVSYLGSIYDVTVKTGSFLDLIAPSLPVGTGLQDQPWWGSSAVANVFAGIYASVNTPFFAASSPTIEVLGCYQPPSSSTSCTPLPLLFVTEWAVATPVAPIPLPAGGLLLLAGIGAVAGVGLRRKRG